MEGLPENLAAATILGAILANLLDFIPTYNQISILVPPPPTLSLPRRLNPFEAGVRSKRSECREREGQKEERKRMREQKEYTESIRTHIEYKDAYIAYGDMYIEKRVCVCVCMSVCVCVCS